MASRSLLAQAVNPCVIGYDSPGMAQLDPLGIKKKKNNRVELNLMALCVNAVILCNVLLELCDNY